MIWRPTASLANLQLRAHLFSRIRQFFAERKVLEVETPLLCQHTVTDLHIESFQSDSRYLQTSPEYAMKRLLAANSGPIFQICKAFRKDESGSQHNPEFTMLEWYRPGFNHHELMDEMDALLQTALATSSAERISYQDLFLTKLGIDPHSTDLKSLQQCAKHHELNITPAINDKDTLLQLLLNHLIEPKLGRRAPTFIYDFPASQAALAKINAGKAERFEVYIQGSEIANGFHELTDSKEQAQRFESDQKRRQKANRFVPAIDKQLIEALEHGMPECAGVAVGLDRLLMILTKTKNIDDVIAFPWKLA